jgi:hypothetical protein
MTSSNPSGRGRDGGEDTHVTQPATGATSRWASSRWRRLRSIEGAAVAGIVAAAGWVVALRGLLDIPDSDATNAEILSHYEDLAGSSRPLVYLQVLVVATIAFLWFGGVIRHRIGAQEPMLFGTVFLDSAILLAGLLFVGLAVAATPAVLVGETDRAVDPDAAACVPTACLEQPTPAGHSGQHGIVWTATHPTNRLLTARLRRSPGR